MIRLPVRSQEVFYAQDGSVIAEKDYDNSKYAECPLAKKFQENIYAKSSMSMPVSRDKEIKSLVKELNKNNVALVLGAYKDLKWI